MSMIRITAIGWLKYQELFHSVLISSYLADESPSKNIKHVTACMFLLLFVYMIEISGYDFFEWLFIELVQVSQ